jgi:hypothetical protein
MFKLRKGKVAGTSPQHTDSQVLYFRSRILNDCLSIAFIFIRINGAVPLLQAYSIDATMGVFGCLLTIVKFQLATPTLLSGAAY